MPDYYAGEQVAVIDADEGPGATAVLHGMLATLSEVLGGLDERLDRLEARLDQVVGGRDRAADAVAALGVNVSSLSARFDELLAGDDEEPPPPAPVIDLDAVAGAVVERLRDRLDALDALVADSAREAAHRAELLDGMRHGLAEDVAGRLSPAVVALPQQVAVALAEQVAALTASLPEQVAAALQARVDAIAATWRDDLAAVAGFLPEQVGGAVREHVDALAAALPVQLAEAVRERVDAMAGSVSAGVAEQVAGLAAFLPEQVSGALRGDVERLALTLGDQMAGIAPSVAARVPEAVREELAAQLSGSNELMAERVGELVAAVRDSVDGLATAESVAALAEPLDRLAAAPHEAAASLRDGQRQSSEAVLARLGEVASSIDAVAYGVSSLTDVLQSGDDEPEVDVAAVVAAEGERVRATVAELSHAVAAASEASVRALSADVARLEAQLRGAFDDAMAVLADRHEGGVQTLAQAIESVRAELDGPGLPELLTRQAEGTRDELTRLETVLRGQVAEVSGRAGSVTDVIGRLDGRLHEVVDGVRALTRNLESLRRQEEPV